MTLKSWEDNGWLKSHTTGKQEITELLRIVERDIKDAGNSNLSSDWQFSIAYNAALKLCKIVLGASGYRTDNRDNHFRTIMSLPVILGNSRANDANYLNSCRIKRNTVEYDTAGATTTADAEELLEFVKEMKTEVIEWLRSSHPEYL